jgi:hypothetical protein
MLYQQAHDFGTSKNCTAPSFRVKQSTKDGRLTLKTKANDPVKYSELPPTKNTASHPILLWHNHVLCTKHYTMAGIYIAVSRYNIHNPTSVLSPLTDHHIYMFHSFPLYTQTISYYSFPSHLLSTNMTQTLVKWKIENYEENKDSNTD